MGSYNHTVGRGDSAAVERNRNYEHQVFMAQRRIDELVEQTRRTFGPGSVHSPQINDARQHIYATSGLRGLHSLIEMFEDCLRRNERPLMDFWTDD